MSRRTGAAVAVAALLAIALGWGLRARRRGAHGVGAPSAGRYVIVGRVVDRLGRPIGGARVLAQAELGPGRAWTTVSSDSDGRYRLPLDSGAAVRVRAEAEGFVPEEVRAVEPPQAGLELTLARRLALDALVRAHGQPAAGVEVTVGGPGGMRSAKSGPDGAVSFVNLAEGRYAVRAIGDGEAAFVDGVVVALGDGGSGLLTIELGPATTLSGRLRDRAGHALDSGAVALSEADGTPLLRTAAVDREGNFRFAGVLAGGYVVEARADGYYPSEPRTVRVGRTPATLELRLERGAEISGRVVDERAQPVAGAQVEVAGESLDGAPIAVTAAAELSWTSATGASQRLEASGELGVLRGPIPYPPATPLWTPTVATAAAPPKMFMTDANGAFRIVGLPAGRLVVAATHPEFARGASEPLRVAAGGEVSVTVVLSRGVRIDGRVVDGDGAPLVGAEIAGVDGVLTVTDARGQYELLHLARAQTLTARAPGFLPASRAVSPSERGPFDFTLRRAEGHLAGDVLDDRGAPLSAARVEIAAPSQPARWFTTDRGGRFRADSLGPAPYRVTVSHPDFAPAILEDVAAGDDFRAQLQPGGGVDGEVRDARTGGAPAAARVELSVGGGKARLLPVVGGRFSATSLPPGRVTLTVTAPGYVTWSRPLDVAGSDRLHEVTARDVRVELERGGSIRGHLRDDHGDPVAGAAVVVASGGARLAARSDRDGDFRVDGVAAGRARVSVEHEGAVAAEDVDVRADDESRVELRLR
jgi:protocatechuate 3,4-dioxygenase beta subunit